MNRGYIRKGTVLAFLRVCRVRMNELMTAYTMESNHEAAQAVYTCRCYLDEEIQQVKKHPAAAVVKVKCEGKTRADRIRAMSDEGLAAWKSDRNQLCPPEYQREGCPYTKSCYDGWLDHLKTED